MNTTSGADGWKPAEHRASLLWLIGIAAATIILWQIPYGSLVIYPLTILATWFHEMGHGVMAALQAPISRNWIFTRMARALPTTTGA